MEGFTKNVFGFTPVFTLVSLLLVCSAMAANFTASMSPTSVNGSLTNQLFNVTINNTDGAYNITGLNLTLPSGFVFVSGSNWTGADNTAFSNTSTVLIWVNETDYGFIENDSYEYFSFNSSTPNSSGNYTITVSILDTNYTSNSTNLIITVDADYPVIVMNYPLNNTNSTNSTVNFNWTVTDSVDTNITCNLTIDGSVNESNIDCESGNYTNVTVSGLTKGQHNWILACWDDFNHVTTTNTSFFNLYPDIIVTQINWSSTPDNHTGAGSNATFKATIKNVGSFDISETINISLWWGDTFIESKENISDLTAESSQIIDFTEITSDSLVTNGLHNIRVNVDSWGDVNEANETNNNRTLQFLVGYNLTILSLEYNGTVYASPEIMSNESFTINVSVQYSNDDPVTDLREANFTHVYDNHGGGSVEMDWGQLGYQGTSLDNFTLTMNDSGVYWFDIVSYYHTTNPLPGVHNLTVGAEKGNYSGSGGGLDYYYLLAPSFTVSFSSLMTSINEGYSDTFNVLATNTGTAVLYNTTAKVNDNHDYLNFSGAPCGGAVTIQNDSNVHTVCSPSMGAQSVTSDQNGCFSATVSGKSNGLYFNTTSTLQCLDVLNVEAGGDGGGLVGGGGCTKDADCSSGYYCSNGVCVKKKYSVAITSYTSSLEVNWSSYATTKVTVKNDGSNSFTAKLSVTLSGLNVTVLPTSMTLDPGNAIMFTVNISVPETAIIGSHSGTFRAYVGEDTSAYQTKTFTLTLLSTPEREREINESYHNYSAIYGELKERFDRMKAIGFINASDLEEVESLLNETYDDLGQAKGALDEGDYATADSILALLNTSLNNIKSKIEGLELEQQEGMGGEWSGIWFWVVIGVVVVIVIIFLIYLLMPSFKGYHPKYGYKPVIKEGFFEKIGKRFKRKRKIKEIKEPEKPSEFRPAYGEGYEKAVSGYRYERGAKGKIKNGFGKFKKKLRGKKKQKEVSEFFGLE